ncbi:MAG: ABC transporter ATP-binding protein/permease [Actinobacteria bacterium]|nr:ABC transporter ATP-binding protein/permease [Actinomycetota bacterium]
MSVDHATAAEDRGGTIAAVRRVARLAPELRRGFGVTVGLALLGTVGQVVVPIVLQRVIDGQLTAPGGADVAAAVPAIAGAVVVLLLALVCTRMALYRLLERSARGLAQLRIATFRHIHDLSALHVQAERRGTLVSRVTSDVSAISDFLEWGGVGMLVGAGQISVTLLVMLAYEWRLAVLVIGGAAVYAAMLVLAQRVLARAWDRVRVQVGETLAALSEVIVGLPTIRAYGAEERSRKRVDDAVDAQRSVEFRAGTLGAVLFSSAELFAASVTAAVVAGGVLLGDISAGTLVAFLFLVAVFIDPVQTVVEVLNEAQSAAAGVRRILEVLDTPREIADPVDGRTLPPGRLDVRFEAVRFAYGDGPEVLSDVTVHIAAGSRVAVVGETGSGKSTFAKLLVRLLDPVAGGISVGDVPLRQVAFASLRSRVAFVPQEGFLFAGTIAENIRYGRPGSRDDELAAALTDLELDDWVASLPDGMDTDVGERGGRLSSGERQLVALARAWIADPDVLVLDEATSAVDPALEVRMQRALEHLTAGRTAVTVAHRLSTAEAADRVLVFDHGRLVEDGTHASLVRTGGVYAAMHADWAPVGRGPSGA